MLYSGGVNVLRSQVTQRLDNSSFNIPRSGQGAGSGVAHLDGLPHQFGECDAAHR